MDKSPDAYRTISEVADDLDVPQHVLRFWETRFSQIRPLKRGGGRRYYRPDDVELLRGIRHLLYGEGYTIRGVQRILKEEGVRSVQRVWRDEDRAAAAAAGALPPPAPSELASLRGEPPDDEEAEDALEVEASDDVDDDPAPMPDAVGSRLPPDSIRRLQQALSELTECRRLIGQALGTEAEADPA
jgi:DNA-binding transcriptional MerR regulator